MRILFVHNHLSRFVKIDRDLLAERYQVSEQCEQPLLQLHPVELWQRVAGHDLVFCWFAGWHSLLPVLFARWHHKPSLVVIGGYDVASIPHIGYGHQRGGFKKWITRLVIHLATALFTNSRYSQREAYQNIGLDCERLRVIYHGVPDSFGTLPLGPRRLMALTVGYIESSNLWRKGHEPFVRAAKFLPDIEFVLVGPWRDRAIKYLRAIASPNVTFTGWLDDDRLMSYYRQALIYVQPSLHEGFGLSVAEAMLAGCIPVVTRVGALPELVGNTGVYLSSNAPEAIAEGVRAALTLNNDCRQQARERILCEFPLEKRRQKLFELIDSLLAGASVNQE